MMCTYPRILSGTREAVSEHERLQNQINAISTQVIRWLDIRFPEFNTVYKAWDGMAALLILKNSPTPAKIARLGVEGIMSIWRQKLKRPSQKKANAIVRAANESIGRTEGSVAAEAALHNLLMQYEMLQNQKESQGQGAEIIPEKVIEAQSLKVDSVSGATYSSKVILKAIQDAILKAGAETS